MSQEIFGEAVGQANVWVGAVADEFDADAEQGYRALRATLHTLRDRLTIEGTAHLSAQLPLIVRGLFFEGWNPSATPDKMHHDQFLERVQDEALLESPEESELAVRAVIKVMHDHMTPGALDHMAAQLPADLQPLVHSR
jgi:uncharacterized protein (DUF2267 family)